jgi:HK97 family phage major capsid protein
VIRTSGGEAMNFPTSDGTSEEGEIVGENGSASDADITFGTKALPVYKYSSKVVTVPWELLQDSSADIEAFVRGRLQTRLGRITNKHFTVGSGVGQPTGIITAATVGKIGAVSATPVITYDDLVDLEHSVDPSYRANAKWMFHDDMLKLIRKIKDSEGRPIFVPGYEQGNPGGAPDRLLNRDIAINQHMAAPAPGAKSISYGDFSYYKVRDVMSVTLFRFTDSAYTKKGQVGFLAWMRSGGNLVDVGGAVKVFQHGAAA